MVLAPPSRSVDRELVDVVVGVLSQRHARDREGLSQRHARDCEGLLCGADRLVGDLPVRTVDSR